MNHVTAAFVMLLGGAALSPLHAGVITVDANPANGADHLQIQDAIDNVSNGDVILVASGHYAGFEVLGPSLDLVADGPVVVHGPVKIAGLSPHDRVSLVGFRIVGLPPSADPYELTNVPPALSIQYCEGTVRVERTNVVATTWQPEDGACSENMFELWPAGRDAVSIKFSVDVVLQTCVFEGGFGIGDANDPAYQECLDYGSNGGHGLSIDNSRVHLHNIIAHGADGAQHAIGGQGGAGVFATGDSVVLASGVVATGGEGAWGTDAIAGFVYAHGGDGLYSDSDTSVAQLGGFYTGGTGGNELSHAVGRDINGEHIVYSGVPHRFVTPGPARENGTLTLSVSGAAGDLAWLVAGFDAALIDKPGYGGALYIAPPFAFGPSLLVSLTQGVTLLDVPIPELGPGIDAIAVDLQLFVLQTDGDKVLTAPARALLLDGAY